LEGAGGAEVEEIVGLVGLTNLVVVDDARRRLEMMGIGISSSSSLQSILMHDPVGFLALGCSSLVKHQRLLHTHQL
jgi:hypothetical protein